MSVEKVRYDPVWRRILQDDYALKLEGKFPRHLHRLEEINNWGALATLYTHASATKRAHHWGVEHNAVHFVDGDPQAREAYRPSFRIAAHVLHWGHIPLAYAGSEALARAAQVDSEWKVTLDQILQDVVSFGNLKCDSESHSETCIAAVSSGDMPFELYRWLSAWQVKRHWSKIWGAVSSLVPNEVEGKHVKQQVIRTLVCRESPGYQILSMCNKADHVPRDLLQSGTAALTVEIDELWAANPIGRVRAKEWSLIDAAKNYLEKRFFEVPEALLVHTLTSRAIAQGLLSKGLTRNLVEELLDADEGDSYYKGNLPPYHRKRIENLREETVSGRLTSNWFHVGTFQTVSIPTAPVLEIERDLAGRSGNGSLSYPFSSGYSIVVLPSTGSGEYPLPGSDRSYYSIQIHHQETGGEEAKAFPALNAVLMARYGLAPWDSSLVGEGIFSWFVKSVVEERSNLFMRVAGEILLDHFGTVADALWKLYSLKSAASLNQHQIVSLHMLTLIGNIQDSPPERLGRTVFGLPWGIARTKYGRVLLELLLVRASEWASDPKAENRGEALEVAVAAHELLLEAEGKDRFVLVGMSQVKEDGTPLREWDVVVVETFGDRTWTIKAIECAISPSAKKKEEEKDRLACLGDSIQHRFADLRRYQAQLATIGEEGEVVFSDAARGFEGTAGGH